MQRLIDRLKAAILTIPSANAWFCAVGLLLSYGLLYLPIGLWSGFLQIHVQRSWQTIASVTAGAFFMPGVLEELGFRALLIPHPTEAIAPAKRSFFIVLSWVLFVAYHLNGFAPRFFHDPRFLLGAGLLGVACTLSYLQSRSLWTPVLIHWLIVTVWLLFLGGLEKFHR